ncbi:RnfH family protein [Legionella londiniensis]|uniref:UPF0125 protein Llon_0202 n=1 Tax=Legionella londiniensis TaxID=45068 RepID=A0A0W0VTL2_9GAMM|nr:RnfH family protein [Legionella londiniensis]KTD23317.1 Persistence and stress-resistance antitoxin PasI [Legionella londiniensis]STX94128.1 protein yfjF [Legionella londiniensis]
MVKVELIYLPEKNDPFHLDIELPEGATIRDALQQSGIHRVHPETNNYPVGIFAQKLPLDTPLKTGDRIEIYRPLALDPKEKRRLKVKKKLTPK